jgi:hypothetical protein
MSEIETRPRMSVDRSLGKRSGVPVLPLLA